MSNILFVEDDPALAQAVCRWMRKKGHSITHTDSIKAALEYVRATPYDVLILDWELPDGTGTDLVRQHRREGGLTPVLMLTQRSKIDDKAEGYGAGVDDYLGKPFDGRELMMRIDALLRRPPSLVLAELSYKNLTLKPESRSATISGTTVHLSKNECVLLELLLRRKEQVLSTESLLNCLYTSEDNVGNASALATCIGRLRKKLEVPGEASLIRNVHGLGYALCEPDKKL